MNQKDRVEIDRVAEALTAAWNAADGAAFGAVFTEDADFVNIRGDHFVGRETIAAGHQGIFDSIYRDSRNVFAISKIREATGEVVVALIEAHLYCPQGPMAGDNDAIATAVMRREPSGWRIASFHNTLKQGPPNSGRPPNRK
jgi:uncharacterized protein (TIGR02246 family)